MTAPSLLPPAHYTFETDDLGTARAHLGRVYWPHVLAVRDDRGGLLMRDALRACGTLGFHEVWYGQALENRGWPGDPSYIFVFSRAGVLTMHAHGGTFASGPDTMFAMNPQRPFRTTIARGHAHVGFKLPARRLQDALERDFGVPLAHRLEFDAGQACAFAQVSGSVGVLGAMLRATLDPDSPLLGGPVAARLEDALVDLILTEVPHSHSALVLERQRAPALPRHVRVARDHIHAHLREPLTVAALARAACVTTRALQYGFQRAYGRTPLEYLRDARLELARRELRAGGAGRSLGAIAAACGFPDPRRFARHYRARFGESPAATLRH